MLPLSRLSSRLALRRAAAATRSPRALLLAAPPRLAGGCASFSARRIDGKSVADDVVVVLVKVGIDSDRMMR